MGESVNTEVERTEVPPQVEREVTKERPSVRESLERTFSDAHKEEEKEVRSRRDTRRDTNTRDASGEFETQEGETDKSETGKVEGEETEVEASQGTQVQTAPAAWAKDAKEAWATLPQQVQAAVLKREQDVEKGIKSLKDQYSELDKAIAPHKEAIQKFGKTPGQAVEQLFAWFQALAQNPDQAIPALIQSYNYDPRKIIQAFGIQPQAAPEPKKEVEEQPEGDISPAVQNYITKLEERINGFEQKVGQSFNGIMGSFQEQSMAKTHEILNTWAKDKPYFNEVRTFMGHLLTPDPNTGVAAVPLKDGRVDLDTAYEMATWGNPEVRAKVLADQKAKADADRTAKLKAEADLQQKQADKSRRASGSIPPGTPGAEVSRKTTPPKGRSVRDSLKDSIEELRS